MTYVLVCALCASTPSASSLPSPPDLSVAATLESAANTADLTLRLRPMAPQLHDGTHSDSGGHGSHMGPMWIAMGVMMVAMMATFGIYMMRRSADAPNAPAAIYPRPPVSGPVGRLGQRFGPG